jgi:hypothetical protein
MSNTTHEENEHIDVSEWLPRPLDVEYPHRVGKADMVRNGGTYCSSASKTPIDLLHDRGVINDEQHRAAVFVMTLRRVINNSLGVDRIFQEYFKDPAAKQDRHIAPSVVLQYALKGLKPYQLNLIDRITALPRGDNDRVSRPITDVDLPWLSTCAASVKETLDAVKINIDLFYEKVKSDSREGTRSVS